MATQQIKCISSQYEEYRNQMKRSRKSEEYRNKRNQQMAQAQKLLDSNLPSEKRTHNSGEKRKRFTNMFQRLFVLEYFRRKIRYCVFFRFGKQNPQLS
jgi:hypothetical protein